MAAATLEETVLEYLALVKKQGLLHDRSLDGDARKQKDMKRKAEDILTGFVRVCGFDFGAVYGDLACLCSNCHRMIHRSRDHVMTPEELKERLRT